MSIIDFTEIPKANISTGKQDTFELFSRDFLAYLGYKIVSEPSRGPDGGVDIIVEESRKGIAGETIIRWLASCKHFVHSKKSVGTTAETNIRDRVEAHSCDGFIGVYSTLPSSALIDTFEGLKNFIEIAHYDSAKIEEAILSSPQGLFLAERYFPESVVNWKRENPVPANVLEGLSGLQCEFCGKELLSDKPISGLVVLWRELHGEDEIISEEIYDMYWSCKGKCDVSLQPRYDRPDAISSWEDLPDICSPTIYLRWVIGLINQLQKGVVCSSEFVEKYKTLLIETFPYVSRELTTKEKDYLEFVVRYFW